MNLLLKNKKIQYVENTISVELSRLLEKELNSASQIIIVTDKTIEKLHLEKIKKALDNYSFTVLVIAPGESAKSRETKADIETALFKLNADRNSLLIALGGGVVSDVTGFVAATYMRGIRYINIPTTLLAMVDSSIGGKTAINTPEGKNLIGAYWQPEKVIIDISLLDSLPQIQRINGLIEALKMFLTVDKAAVSKFTTHLDLILNGEKKITKWIVEKSISIKSAIVEKDEREAGWRKILNYGHTVGHAIEKLSGYQVWHGMAVGYGILVESQIACQLNQLSLADYQKIKSILTKLTIQPKYLLKYKNEALIDAMRSDKKNQFGEIYCVLLNSIGSVYQKNNVYAQPIQTTDIDNALNAINNEGID